MKYYSEVTKKIYNTEEELTSAENKLQYDENIRKKEKEEFRKKIEDIYTKTEEARKVYIDDQTHYINLIKEYTKKYNEPYSYTIHGEDPFELFTFGLL